MRSVNTDTPYRSDCAAVVAVPQEELLHDELKVMALSRHTVLHAVYESESGNVQVAGTAKRMLRALPSTSFLYTTSSVRVPRQPTRWHPSTFMTAWA